MNKKEMVPETIGQAEYERLEKLGIIFQRLVDFGNESLYLIVLYLGIENLKSLEDAGYTLIREEEMPDSSRLVFHRGYQKKDKKQKEEQDLDLEVLARCMGAEVTIETLKNYNETYFKKNSQVRIKYPGARYYRIPKRKLYEKLEEYSKEKYNN